MICCRAVEKGRDTREEDEVEVEVVACRSESENCLRNNARMGRESQAAQSGLVLASGCQAVLPPRRRIRQFMTLVLRRPVLTLSLTRIG